MALNRNLNLSSSSNSNSNSNISSSSNSNRSSSCNHSTSSLFFLLAAFLSLAVCASAATDFIPCSATCDGGDVNYDLVASVRTMSLMNSTYRGRTFSTGKGEPGKPSFMGPTMRVKPGQSIWIKLSNKMGEPADTEAAGFGPNVPTATDYWKMLQKPGEAIKYQFYKKAVADPSLMIVDTPNIPHNFDSTNLHIHGLDIEVHMFDPVGTHSKVAPHIVIDPDECYCYKFNVPEHQPDGMYWYHPHVHGSSAIQIWSGMIGLFYVEGPMQDELTSYGVTRSEEFVIWDPAFKSVKKQTHNLEVDEFLLGQTTLSKIHPFLVNGQYTPNFNVRVNEVLHFRTLCATIENENTFIVYPEGKEHDLWEDSAIPFWIFATDGVTFRKPLKKTLMVVAGGQRHEMLLQFDKPGKYVISQQGIEGMQFFDMLGHPHEQLLATITVTGDENDKSFLPSTPIPDMRFTPGYDESEDIQAHDIVKTETIVFSMGANRNQAPFPQYYVNGKSFDPNRLDFQAQPGEAIEYILINGNHNVHPFHIHVNRFQVQEMGSEVSTTKYPVLAAVMDFSPTQWRDTVVIPPNGRTRIWVQYKNYTGKTVFHCHFLAHEDTGMMATLFIGPVDFHWGDHMQLLIGSAIGALLTAVLILATWWRCTEKKELDYSPVGMNEMKAKVLD